MTTQNAPQGAPTADEIRAAVRRAVDESSGRIDVDPWIRQMTIPLDVGSPYDLWGDLPAEADDRLSELIETAYRQADTIRDKLVDELVEAVVTAALTFAAEYPDAPRAER